MEKPPNYSVGARQSSREASNFCLAPQIFRPSYGPMLLLGGGEMAFVRDAIHFCYCCHSELSTFFFFLFLCDSGSEGIRSKSWFSSVVVRVPSPSSHFSFSSNLMQANFRICLHLSAWNIHRWLTLGTLLRINGKIKESKHHIHWRCTQEWNVYFSTYQILEDVTQ